MGFDIWLKALCPKCGKIESFNPDWISESVCPECKTKVIPTTTKDYQYDLMTTEEREKWDARMREKYVFHSDEFDLELYSKVEDDDFERHIKIEVGKREEVEKSKIHCPKCCSTNVTAGQRGFNIVTGFLGSGSTVNRCAN